MTNRYFNLPSAYQVGNATALGTPYWSPDGLSVFAGHPVFKLIQTFLSCIVSPTCLLIAPIKPYGFHGDLSHVPGPLLGLRANLLNLPLL